MSASRAYGVRVLGLYGVGGIGKSTACMTLCNEYFKEFHGRVCHVEFGDGNEVQMLQKVLKKLTTTKHELIEKLSKDECKDRMKRAIKDQRVLLAIDNVSASHDVIDQAKGMLRSRFEEGSIVVVTARSLGELRNVNIQESECMEMPELMEDEAVALFLYHAAPGVSLEDVERTVTRRCVERCRFGKGNGVSRHYHPLALKVLGGQLGTDPGEWVGKLERMDPFNQHREKDDMHPIFSILRRSFDTLNDEDQAIFMDVAIFAPSTSGQFEENIFEWLGMVHGRRVDGILTMLRGLKSKSLLEYMGDGSRAIGMHDLWREFAIMEAKGSELNRRRWIYENACVANDPQGEESCLLGGGWKGLQRICVVGNSPAWNGEEYVIDLKEIDLSRYSNLRVLKLVDVHLESEVLDLSSFKRLKSFQIRTCQPYQLSAPDSTTIFGLRCPRNLVHLRLEKLRSETNSLYEEIGTLTNLQVLHVDLRSSSRADKFPDLSRLTSLRNVRLVLNTVAENLAGLSSKMANLRHLNLEHWHLLRSCPGVGDLLALEELVLLGCSNLEELPNLGRLKNLRKLNVSLCSSIEGVPGLGDFVSLQEFRAYDCFKLAELPGMRMLANLEKLSMERCPLIKAIPGLGDLIALRELEADFGAFEGSHGLRMLTKLEAVRVRGWSCEGLPCLSDLVNLKNLMIHNAKGVDELSALSLNLPSLQLLDIRTCGFKGVPCLSNLTALTSLGVWSCYKLEGLPEMNRLSKLEKLEIEDCCSMREWKIGSGLRPFGTELVNSEILLQLQSLKLSEMAFTELPDLSSFPQLKILELCQCRELTKLTSSAPLTALESLKLCECGNLRTLPDWRQLVSLRDFCLEFCGELQMTAHEVEQLELMCPGLEVDFDWLFDVDGVSDNESADESDDGSDDERAEKRLKLVEDI